MFTCNNFVYGTDVPVHNTEWRNRCIALSFVSAKLIHNYTRGVTNTSA
jgi:hypothetical protein